MSSNITIKIKFCSIFPINVNERYKEKEDVLKIIKKKNKKVLCKNFLFFFFFLRSYDFVKNLSFFVFPSPSKRAHKSVLRPPYKNKISRHPLGFSKWNFILTFKFKQMIVPEYNDLNLFFFDLYKIFNCFFFFQTNIAFQQYTSVNYDFFFNSNFTFNNF